MTTIFTKGSESVTPLLVLAPTQAEFDSGVILHQVLGRETPDVSFTGSKARSGQWRALFADYDTAIAAVYLMRASGPLTVTSDDEPWLAGTFVPTGTIELAQDAQIVARWILTVTLQEVTA